MSRTPEQHARNVLDAAAGMATVANRPGATSAQVNAAGQHLVAARDAAHADGVTDHDLHNAVQRLAGR